MKIIANKIDIEVEDSGTTTAPDGRARPVVLLIMGLGMQLIVWPPAFVQALLDAGYRVVRFDNRDIGRSQHFDQHGKPRLAWAALRYRLRLPVKSPYSLSDMAADALGVLDVLQIRLAHVVGISMGAMIAQRLALAAPDRVLSLTSIMGTSSARGLPEARPEVLRVMLRRPASSAATDVINYYVRLLRAIASPAYPSSEAELREQILVAYERSFHPVGTLRQALAVLADGRRADELNRITAPTLVLHGRDDPLVPLASGKDTARRIPGARLVSFEGVGHDLPPGVVALLLGELIPFLAASGPSASTPASLPEHSTP